MTTTLLAVDDSKTMRKVLEMTFAGEDFKAVLAENADDALAKLRSERPGIALVDATLGDSNGYDVCQALKREAPQVPVLMLTSKHQPYDRARGGTVGADDFIDKPFDTQQLIDKVTTLIQKGASAPARPVAAAPAMIQPTQPGVGATGARSRAPTLAYGTPPNPGAAGQAAPAARPAPAPAFGGPAQRPAPAPATPAARPGAAPATSFAAKPIQPAARPAAPVASPAASRAPAVAPAAARAAAAPAPAAVTAPTPIAAAVDGQLAGKLEGLGLTSDQAQAVLALSREVLEKVVWEVVPVLAETMIKEEIARLTAD